MLGKEPVRLTVRIRFSSIQFRGSHGPSHIAPDGQIHHLLRVTPATSRHAERGCLFLLLGLTGGMRLTETAQIEVQDVLFRPAHVETESALARRSRKGGQQRCIFHWPRKTHRGA